MFVKKKKKRTALLNIEHSENMKAIYISTQSQYQFITNDNRIKKKTFSFLCYSKLLYISECVTVRLHYRKYITLGQLTSSTYNLFQGS